uniref:Uncharacterized protein n=1 Tax=Cucumis melo TaxID=3656 RepID=A0A9I9E4T3_CUCME
MVVVQRHSLELSWATICSDLQTTLAIRCTINPFLDKKALPRVYDPLVAKKLQTHTLCYTN